MQDYVPQVWKNITGMKMCPMSIGLTKLDHIVSQHSRGTSIGDKVEYAKNDWFAKIHRHDKTNVARKFLSIDIPRSVKGER